VINPDTTTSEKEILNKRIINKIYLFIYINY